MGVQWGTTIAERRVISGRRSAPSQPAAGFLARCLAVLVGPSAELGRDRHLSARGRAPHLDALERVHRRLSA